MPKRFWVRIGGPRHPLVRTDRQFKLGVHTYRMPLWPTGTVVALVLSLGWLRIVWGEVKHGS